MTKNVYAQMKRGPDETRACYLCDNVFELLNCKTSVNYLYVFGTVLVSFEILTYSLRKMSRPKEVLNMT